MTREGFAFSTKFKVRYAEIDGQKVVFNSRYLEYADVAITEYWEWADIASLGEIWRGMEFHVRRAEVDYLKPFVLGHEVEAFVRTESVGRTSLVTYFELAEAATGDLHTRISMVSVNVDLATGRPQPIPEQVRAFFEAIDR
jgi:acyl-CoA thioester hydrolase